MIVLGVLVLLFVIFVGYVIYDSEKQKKALDNEINRILGLDILSDNVDINIVTHEEYAVIELKMLMQYHLMIILIWIKMVILIVLVVFNIIRYYYIY